MLTHNPHKIQITQYNCRKNQNTMISLLETASTTSDIVIIQAPFNMPDTTTPNPWTSISHPSFGKIIPTRNSQPRTMIFITKSNPSLKRRTIPGNRNKEHSAHHPPQHLQQTHPSITPPTQHQQSVNNRTNPNRPSTPNKMHPSRGLQRTPSHVGVTNKENKTLRSTNRNHHKQPPPTHQQTIQIHLQLPHRTWKIRPGPSLHHTQHNRSCNKLGSRRRRRNWIKSRSYRVGTLFQLHRISTTPIIRTI